MSVPYWLEDQTWTALASKKTCCINCRFSRLSKRSYAGLECARHNPIMVEHKSSCAEWIAPGWPDVSAGDWCGEHEPDQTLAPVARRPKP